MSLNEFLDNLTLEEIEELKRLKLAKQNSYNFSKITFKDLEEIFKLKKSYEEFIFDSWFENQVELNKSDVDFLSDLIKKEAKFIESYNEEDLKINYISPILSRVDFKIIDLELRAFYEEKLSYESEKFKLSGICDFMIAKGIDYPKKPYFFIQEFKKSIEANDPRPQLIAELISAIEISSFTKMKGAYIIGAIWNFMIVEKESLNSYKYYVSKNFDSTKIEDLKEIYKNLLFVKEEIKNFAKDKF